MRFAHYKPKCMVERFRVTSDTNTHSTIIHVSSNQRASERQTIWSFRNHASEENRSIIVTSWLRRLGVNLTEVTHSQVKDLRKRLIPTLD